MELDFVERTSKTGQIYGGSYWLDGCRRIYIGICDDDDWRSSCVGLGRAGQLDRMHISFDEIEISDYII